MPSVSAAAGVWEVELRGCFVAYEEEQVQSTLEAAYRAGEDSVRVMVRGKAYLVGGLQSPRKRQRLESDPTRTRPVLRRVN